ncbi:MAG: type II toxin-antitoxin system Phd/YefM family antitoxin [Gemmatimonadota bacterium]
MHKKNPLIVRETVGLYEAKTHLSALVDRAAEGEEIVISKSGKPKARLVPMGDVHPHREPGKGRGEWSLSDDFDAPLPPDILEGLDIRTSE